MVKKKITTRRRRRRGRVKNVSSVVGFAPVNQRASVANASTIRVKGRDAFAAVAGSTTDYLILLNEDVTAEALGMRIGLLSRLYQQYTVNALSFDVVLNGSLTDHGSFILCFYTDPVDPDPPATELGWRQLASHAHHVDFAFLSGQASVSLPVKMRQPGIHFYTDPSVELREYIAGRLFLMNFSATATLFIKVFVNYDITFYEPAIRVSQLLTAAYTHSQTYSALTGASTDNYFDHADASDNTNFIDYFRTGLYTIGTLLIIPPVLAATKEWKIPVFPPGNYQITVAAYYDALTDDGTHPYVWLDAYVTPTDAVNAPALTHNMRTLDAVNHLGSSLTIMNLHVPTGRHYYGVPTIGNVSHITNCGLITAVWSMSIV